MEKTRAQLAPQCLSRSALEEQNKNLKDKCAMYEKYIVKHHGRPALDRLNLQFAIDKTDDFANIRTMDDFEEAIMRGVL